MFEEVLQDLKLNALEQWDYGPAFPNEYTGNKGAIFVTGWGWQVLDDLQKLTNQGQLSNPIISIDTVPVHDDQGPRSFGGVYSITPSTPNTTYRLGRRALYGFVVVCWADTQLGGMKIVRKLGGQVLGAMLYYSNRLNTIRHIKCVHTRETYEGAAQLYRFDLTFQGDVFYTVDV